MPTQNFMDLLAQGRDAWNTWREEHRNVIPDLRAAMAPYDFDLGDRNLSGLDFSGMDFREVKIRRNQLVETNFRYANLSRSNLGQSAFRYADFTHADLSEAVLFSTHFIQETKLHWTNFAGAKLGGAHFEGARLAWTVFAGNDLTSVHGLDRVRHDGPITVGIDTVYLSQGRFPATFLIKAQMRDEAISFIRSVAEKSPVSYHSCFVSYSSGNKSVAQQIVKDLTNAGVVCWFATESLRSGQDFREGIAEAIRRHDKLLVLISHKSLNSEWVEREVTAALDQEGQRGNVIVPIALDEALMDTDKAWARNIRDSRHVINFRTRGQSNNYYEALRKLLQGLEKHE